MDNPLFAGDDKSFDATTFFDFGNNNPVRVSVDLAREITTWISETQLADNLTSLAVTILIMSSFAGRLISGLQVVLTWDLRAALLELQLILEMEQTFLMSCSLNSE